MWYFSTVRLRPFVILVNSRVSLAVRQCRVFEGTCIVSTSSADSGFDSPVPGHCILVTYIKNKYIDNSARCE